MKTSQLIRNSSFYYWRTNLAMALGVVAGTAVIVGALVVGDSVRHSLRAMTLERLGRIDHAVNSHRFFREDLADELAQRPAFQERYTDVAPALVMQGGLEFDAESSDGDGSEPSMRLVGDVNVYGVDERLWKLTNHGDLAPPSNREILLSPRTAEQLGVRAGDDVTLWIKLPTSIPRDTLLGGMEERVSQEIVLNVRTVLPAALGVARLDLNPNQQLPLNAFISLETMQSTLELARVRPSRRNPEGSPARVNALFASARQPTDQGGATAPQAADRLTQLLSQTVTLEDLRLRLREQSERGYLALESEQMILEEVIADAGREAAKSLGMRTSQVLVYLVNELANAESPEHYSMYSIVAGLRLDREPPFGPFEFSGQPPELPLDDGEIATGGTGRIVVNEWLAQDLQVQPGEDVVMKYHVVGSHGELPEEERTFEVAGIAKLDDTPAADRGLTPHVAGITDADRFIDWDQPFPMKISRITDRDEDYWDRYRATPKAFISLSAAQHLWRSRYGQLTSLRVAKLPDTSLEDSRQTYRDQLLASLNLERLNLDFRPVKHRGLTAASGTTDFSVLFIAFSFFLILSSTILIGLLFRLNIERRADQVGLLSAVGWTPRRVRRVYWTEACCVLLAGAGVGAVVGVGYAWLMVYGLRTWWIGAIGTRFLEVSVEPLSLVMGVGISIAVAVIAVGFGLRQLRGLSIRALLAGVAEKQLGVTGRDRRQRRNVRIGIGCVGLAGLLLAGVLSGLVPAREAFFGLSWQVCAFFVVGLAVLTASLTFLSAWFESDRSAAVRGRGIIGLGRLGMRNAARHRQRSVLSTGLIASAAFVIVAIAAGHRNPAVERPDFHSGNGGFWLVAESSTPLLHNLDSKTGRADLGVDLEAGSRAAELVETMNVVPFRVKPGENASCLNIYQTRVPTILGVPRRMIERGGFKFVNAERDNPWTVLNEENEDGSIPVLGDMNSLMYSLHKGPGETIPVPNAENPDHTLRVAGMFDGSVFQGVLLMSEENFQRLYPERVGYQYFLIGDGRGSQAGTEDSEGGGHADQDRRMSRQDAEDLLRVLESQLAAYGFDAEPVADRLANFLAVQNTYLSTFQTLGGLGLLLGTFGLGTVMLRNVMERRSELALLRAVGFRKASLAVLVVFENAFLLLWGLLSGTVSALLAMAPHLTSIGADVPWKQVALILGGVFLVGMLAAIIAVTEAVRTPILSTLRSE